jgi:hypothetical protein
MKKQTAIEWFVNKLFDASGVPVTEKNNPKLFQLIDQAKAMEKEQIENAAGIGHFEGMGKAPMSSIEYFEYAVEFYKKHYGS